MAKVASVASGASVTSVISRGGWVNLQKVPFWFRRKWSCSSREVPLEEFKWASSSQHRMVVELLRVVGCCESRAAKFKTDSKRIRNGFDMDTSSK